MLWLNKLCEHLEDYVSHNMITNIGLYYQIAKTSQDWHHFYHYGSRLRFNGSQLAKMKKSIPDMSLPWNL